MLDWFSACGFAPCDTHVTAEQAVSCELSFDLIQELPVLLLKFFMSPCQGMVQAQPTLFLCSG